jgi:nitrite reductase/ring-hydroxylating ferredoxin subunit/DMSO/TMAO reductase YedYZ heme-binding membrane subunit
MSIGFRAVQWNRDKLIYDAVVIAGIAIYMAAFVLIARHLHPPKDRPADIDIWIRAYGSCAFLMLTVILSIGPLARLDRRFLPLLYNRRHFGVMTFLMALMHAWLMVLWFTVQNALPDLITEMTSWANYGKFIGFPFKALGLGALLVLFLMAATSHDFWLVFLTPWIWKSLHMTIYIAYGLVAMHVALGIMLYERTLLIPLMLFGSVSTVTLLHALAGWRERGLDRGMALTGDGWITVGAPRDIPDRAAQIVCAPGGERIAVFRDGDEIGALTNLCAHQNGPLGEGRIVDGCVTCPWHGYQYRLADGCAPPPFAEKLTTYRVRISRGLVEVDPRPLPSGTRASIKLL